MFSDEFKIPLSMLRISYLDKQKFTGSYKGTRFLYEKSIDKDNITLKLYLYKDQFAFEYTDKKDMEILSFEYSKDGIKKSLDYLDKRFSS